MSYVDHWLILFVVLCTCVILSIYIVTSINNVWYNKLYIPIIFSVHSSVSLLISVQISIFLYFVPIFCFQGCKFFRCQMVFEFLYSSPRVATTFLNCPICQWNVLYLWDSLSYKNLIKLFICSLKYNYKMSYQLILWSIL